jgi:putative DNA primase/helicase
MHDFREWAIQSGNRGRLDAMQAVTEPLVTKHLSRIDSNPFLFNVQNGTLELGNKEDRDAVRLRRHSRLDLITRIAPIGYDAEAACPAFHIFIDKVLPDREVQRWIQKYLGYSLTGLAREHILVMLLGEGRNGKGTLVRLCLWLWGDYAATISFASLAADDRRRGSEASPDIARLPGVRLLFAAEPRKGVRLDDGRIKELTGEDRQLARHLNRGLFEFDPQFKLAIQANNRPRIEDTSTGMWERVRLVPFDIIIPPNDRDLDLLDKLKAEGPGILNWMLDGYRLYCDEGLTTPPAIMAATDKYRSEIDEIGQFLAAATVPNREGSVVSAQLFACYEGWARDMDLRAITRTMFGSELSDRGYRPDKRGRGNDRKVWRTGLTWSDAAINREWHWKEP